MVNICKHCQKQYISARKSYCCQACKDIDKMRYEEIRAYLAKYPNSNALQVSEALDIKAYTVLRYVEEGSLTFGKGEFEQI